MNIYILLLSSLSSILTWKQLSLIQALKIKTLFEDLQDYKVISVKGLQGYIYLREGLQDYKRGRITKVFLRETSLHKEPVYFNCYPNFALSLSDRHIMDALTLKC